MKNIFRNNKKILFILPLFFIVYITYLALFQLNTLVSLGVRIFTQGTIKIEKVEIEKGSSIKEGRIEIINSQLYDERGKEKFLITDSPKIIIDYKDWKIEKINIYNPKAVFVRDESDINFVNVFVGDNDKKSNKKAIKKSEKKKPNTSNPILKRINVYNADLVYIDRSYSHEIKKEVDNVNGYVQFNKGYKVDLKFTGNREKEKYTYIFDNRKMSYDMRIILENIQAEDPLVQYGYDSKGDIKNVSGLFNMDLRINEKGFFGWGKLDNGSLKYEDLNAPIEDAQLDMKFLGEKIVIDGNYLFFNKKGKFSVEYNAGKGVDVNLALKNPLFNEIAEYKLVKDTGIKIDDFAFDDVNINLSVKNHFKAQIDFLSAKGFKKEVIDFSNIRGQIVYENGSVKINNVHADVKLDKEGRTIEREINGRLNYKADTGKVVVSVRSPKDEFLSKIDLSFLFSVKKNALNFKLDSDIIDLRGKYNFKSRKLSLNQKDNFEMVYDIEKNYIEKLKGYIDFTLEQYIVKTHFKTDNGYNIELESKLLNEKNEVKGIVEGFADIKTFDYDFKMRAKEVNLKDYSGSIAGSIEGYIRGKKDNFNGEFLLDKFSVGAAAQNLMVSNISGVVTLDKKRELSVIYQGEIGNIKQNENEINGFKISAKYSEGILEVMNAANKFLTLNGKYSIINSTADISIRGRNINRDVIKISEINYSIEEIDGKISGDLKNLKGKFVVNNGVIDLGEERVISFGGDINYLQNKVYTEKFKINENRLSFEYDIDRKMGRYNIDIFENLLSEFILGVKFRIIGMSEGIINGSKIEGSFKGSVNEFYYKGSQIPNILFQGNYNNEKVDFKNIDILSDEDKKLVTAQGIINLTDKSMNFTIPKQQVPIKELLNKKNIDGSIEIEGRAEGTAEKYTFDIKGLGGKVIYKDVTIDNIGIDLSGDKEKISLNSFTAGYINNILKANGKYNMADGKYKFNVSSSDIDLKFLTIFLEEYGIDDISGKGKIDLIISDIVPEGEIILNNFNLSGKKYGLDLKNLNGDIVLEKGYLRIKKFKGILNEGTINIGGYLEASKAVRQLLDENFGRIDYNLSLEGKNVNYSYEDYFNLNFDTKLNFRRNAIFGNLTINEGNINKIINEDFGLVTIIKNFIKNFIARNKAQGMVLKSNKRGAVLENDTVSGLRVDVRFNIDKGIDINVNKATNFFTNLRGTVMGQGRLSGSLGRLNFLGETNIKDGEFSLNGNKFTIDRALILFNNRNEYIPDLNPDIVFTTNSIINNKNLEISLSGPARNLTFTVRSGNEVSVNSLDSVLNGDGVGENGNNVSIFLTNIIGGQISDILINPIVEVLRGIGFSNLNVRSSILAEERKTDAEQESSMTLGAYVEAESPIYKDKLFWKIKVNFIGDAENNDNSSNNGANYGVADYDINVYNRINKNISWGVGAQKLRENLETKNRDMNYYIELKFEKKFDF